MHEGEDEGERGGERVVKCEGEGEVEPLPIAPAAADRADRLHKA